MSTLDTRTPAEKAYDDLHSGAIYVRRELPEDVALDGDEADLIRLLEAIETTKGVDAAWQALGIKRPVGTGIAYTPYGTLTTGETIYGTTEKDEPTIVIECEGAGFSLCVETGNVAGTIGRLQFDELSPADIAVWKRLVETGTFDQLFDAAGRWAAGMA